ncbi:MAG: hypothetical protein NZO58_03140 [Gemmataceae bacterium]|nr:hypothetical protein [Gemmataceae bacterium]
MANTEPPLVLQLAPLPRQQIGPFLILGVDKDADKDTIESAWAQRLIWARKNLTRVPLEDINWAREIIGDPERRLRADAVSFNIDTTDGLLRRLRERYQGEALDAASCKPIDVEKDLSGYAPPTPVPAAAEVRAQVPLPAPPPDLPAVSSLLGQAVQTPPDPWEIHFEAAVAHHAATGDCHE